MALTKMLATIVLLLPLVLSFQQYPLGHVCIVDSECMEECCSNDRQYSVEGVCVDAAEHPRCVTRKKLDREILHIFMAFTFTSFIFCATCKVIRDNLDAKKLANLKNY